MLYTMNSASPSITLNLNVLPSRHFQLHVNFVASHVLCLVIGPPPFAFRFYITQKTLMERNFL